MGVLWCNEENGSHVAHAMREGGSCSCNAMGGGWAKQKPLRVRVSWAADLRLTMYVKEGFRIKLFVN